MPKSIEALRIKIFADGAEKDNMINLARQSFIKGFTTNPTLMRKSGVTDYVGFAKSVLSIIKDKPVSFEVFSDDFREMERQARTIAKWADNIYVKIPITSTKGGSSFDLIKNLSASGIKINATAILTLEQVKHIAGAFATDTPGIISVFAGRIADTGRDPVPLMKKAKEILGSYKNLELLWASPRELLNIFQAEEAGCDIITVTSDILKKIEKIGYDLNELSLETVKMFYEDGQKVGYALYEL